MSDESRRILDLLAQGRITADEADQLLKALGTRPAEPTESAESEPAQASTEARTPRYFRISVTKNAAAGRPEKRVDIRVPIALVRGGMRFGGLVPGFVSEKVHRKLREKEIDIDLSKLDEKRIDEVLQSLDDVVIDINEGDEHVKIVRE
jgi:hypothetical protein